VAFHVSNLDESSGKYMQMPCHTMVQCGTAPETRLLDIIMGTSVLEQISGRKIMLLWENYAGGRQRVRSTR
jgi:hypothetical protein